MEMEKQKAGQTVVFPYLDGQRQKKIQLTLNVSLICVHTDNMAIKVSLGFLIPPHSRYARFLQHNYRVICGP